MTGEIVLDGNVSWQLTQTDQSNNPEDGNNQARYTVEPAQPRKSEAPAQQADSPGEDAPPRGGTTEDSRHDQGCREVVASCCANAETGEDDGERENGERVGQCE